MIKVRCKTNLDNFKGKNWPEAMITRPLKGDMVRASCGAVLYVVGVTHVMGSNNLLDIAIAGEPYLIVELHQNYSGVLEGMMTTIKNRLKAIWYFIIYGVPKICTCKVVSGYQSRWFIIRCAWLAAKMVSVPYKSRKKNENKNRRKDDRTNKG